MDETLASLKSLSRVYESVLDERAVDPDADMARWMSDIEHEAEATSRASGDDDSRVRPHTTRIATCLAQRFLMKARAETLERLGEGDAAVRLIQDELRRSETHCTS